MLRRMLAFAGPAYLVSVGYMDPGNWATDLQGGLAIRLSASVGDGAFEPDGDPAPDAGRASGNRRGARSGAGLPRGVSARGVQWLWVLCEIAIAACDLAEVLGAAIALHLLFGLPLVFGVLLTAADTLLVLWLSRYGIRLIEAMILSLIAIVDGLFPGRAGLRASRWLHEIFSGLDSAAEQSELVRRGGNSGRDGDAAQSLSAFGAGADAADRQDASPSGAKPAGSTSSIPASR